MQVCPPWSRQRLTGLTALVLQRRHLSLLNLSVLKLLERQDLQHLCKTGKNTEPQTSKFPKQVPATWLPKATWQTARVLGREPGALGQSFSCKASIFFLEIEWMFSCSVFHPRKT